MENIVEVDGYPFTDYWFADGRRLKSGRADIPTYRQVKLLLIEKYSTCYWCDNQVVDYLIKDGQSFPDDLATIDHVKPRQIRRKYQKVQKVLACYKCNQKRNTIIQTSPARPHFAPPLATPHN